MIKYLQLLVIASLTTVVVGCASTPSQPKSFNQLGQFQQIPLNANTYRIQFKADHDLSYNHAEEIALVKSAQVTIQEGFEFFKVMDDPSNRSNQNKPRQAIVYPSRSSFSGYYGNYYHPRYHRHPFYWDDPFFNAPYTVDIDPVEVSYTIQTFKKENAPGDAFEAKKILQSLGDKYQLNPDGTAKVIPIKPTTP